MDIVMILLFSHTQRKLEHQDIVITLLYLIEVRTDSHNYTFIMLKGS